MNTFIRKRSFPCRFLLVVALFSLCAQGLFAQAFSLKEFEFELRGFESEDGVLGVEGTLKTGAVASFGRHFNLSAGVELSSSNVLGLFHPNEDERIIADFEVTSLAFEFPFYNGWSLTPVVFMGTYTDVASSDFLLETLKVKMQVPEFLRYGTLSVFSNETYTQGLAAGFAWRAEVFPIAAAAYAGWNGSAETPAFNVYAQTSGSWRGLSWNVFAVLGNGKEDSIANLSTDDLYMTAGLSALAISERNFSIYMQAKMLPLNLSSPTNLESRFHLLFEPRYTGRFFATSAAFFISPVMQEKDIPFLDLEEGVLYAGTNLMLEGIFPTVKRKSTGLNFTLLVDTSTMNDSYSSWQDIMRICVSPFFKMDLDIFTLTVSAFLNINRITSPLSAGEINLHIEAAL